MTSTSPHRPPQAAGTQPGRAQPASPGDQQPAADERVVAQVLSALAGDDGEPSQRARAALAGMTTRICGRYSAEARAIAASRPDFGRAARLLARRAEADPRFASGFCPWLAAAQMLLPRSGGQR